MLTILSHFYPIYNYLILSFYILLQLVLIPKYTELPGFQGNGAEAEHRREEMARYMCLDSFMITPMPALAEMCSKLICSISSIIHDGALCKYNSYQSQHA